MIKDIFALGYLASIDPGLAILARKLKRTKKTFLGYPQLLSLVQNVRLVRARNPLNLQIAEFGVGRGGSAAILAWLVQRYNGCLFLFDVFSRIPPPTVIDGAEAHERYHQILTQESPQYYGNLPNLMDLIITELSEICQRDRLKLISGKYEDTLLDINLDYFLNFVHIDCDWYESTKTVLAFLENHLHPNAVLQIDDYHTWQGSKRAIDEAVWLQKYIKSDVGDALVIDTGKHAV